MENGNFCPKCGDRSEVGAIFCKNCGEKLQEPSTTQETPPPQQNYYENNYTNNNYGEQQQPQGVPPYGYQRKSKMAAGLLQIFLGGLGIGRFYLGYTGVGVAQLIITICTCGFGAIWGFVDGILILTGSPNVDANGVPLSD